MLSALLIFIFLSPLPFLLVISLCHLSTSTSICRALKCPAGQTDAGLDRSGKVIWDASCTQAHTHKRTRTHTLITDTPGQQTHTPPFFALWPACLHFHWSASTLPNGFFSSSILLHLFSLCVIQNNKCSGPRRIHRQIFHLTLAWIPPPHTPFCDVFLVFQWDRCNFLSQSLTLAAPRVVDTYLHGYRGEMTGCGLLLWDTIDRLYEISIFILHRKKAARMSRF